jgi:hypothetical protein
MHHPGLPWLTQNIKGFFACNNKGLLVLHKQKYMLSKNVALFKVQVL